MERGKQEMERESSTAIEVSDLRKSFDSVKAVEGISFSVVSGEIFGLLGPNGAGKTTTINMLIGLARPDSGRIRINGLDVTNDPKYAQHLIGVVPDESNLYPELSGFENLCFCAALYGIPRQEREMRAKDLLNRFGLKEAADRKFAGYSKGMKRKLTIAAGIIHKPSILFLDEPTTGIDVASARQIRQMIADLNSSGTTIFLTTHYIEEAERLCQRIAFILSGEIIRIDTMENLLKPVKGQYILQITISEDSMLKEISKDEFLAAFPSLRFDVSGSGQVKVRSHQQIPVGPLVRFFEERGGEVLEARRIVPSLEEVFVELTGVKVDLMKKEKEKSTGGVL